MENKVMEFCYKNLDKLHQQLKYLKYVESNEKIQINNDYVSPRLCFPLFCLDNTDEIKNDYFYNSFVFYFKQVDLLNRYHKNNENRYVIMSYLKEEQIFIKSIFDGLQNLGITYQNDQTFVCVIKSILFTCKDYLDDLNNLDL